MSTRFRSQAGSYVVIYIYARAAWTTVVTMSSTKDDTKKSSVQISKIDETRRRIIFNEPSKYYGLEIKKKLYILNPGKDSFPKLDTPDYQWCHLAFHVVSSPTQDAKNCFISSDGQHALVCTAPSTEAPFLVASYTLEFGTYIIDDDAGSRDERRGEAWERNLKLIETKYGAVPIDEDLELIENLIIAPARVYERLEPILATELAKIDPNVSFRPEAEELYQVLIKLLKTRPASTESIFPDVFHLLTALELKKTMDTLQKWNEMDSETDRIRTATHTVIHALYAIRRIHNDTRALNLIMTAFVNIPLPQPTRTMTLTEAVVTLLSWDANLKTNTEWNTLDWVTNFFQMESGVLTFRFHANPELFPQFLDTVEQAVSKVFGAVKKNTLTDPFYHYVYKGEPLKYSSANDIVTLYVELPAALKKKVADYCNIKSDILILPLLHSSIASRVWNLQIAVLEPTKNLDIADAFSRYHLDDNHRPAFPLSKTTDEFCEIFLLTAYHNNHELIDVHLERFFFKSTEPAKKKFWSKCGVSSEERAPRLLAAIRDTSFDLGALSLSLHDWWQGRLNDSYNKYSSVDLKSSAKKIAFNEPISARDAALFARHGTTPDDLAGPKTSPKSRALAVHRGGYYGKVGFIKYKEAKFGESFNILKTLPSFRETAELHVCPRPALVTVQFTDKGKLETVVLSIPWSYSTTNAHELICEHIARKINQNCDCKLKTMEGKELSAEAPKELLYEWHKIDRELKITATVERKAAKRPASTSPQRPERERSPISYEDSELFELHGDEGAAPLRLASFVDTCL